MIRRALNHGWTLLGVRLLLSGVFIYAGAVKMISPYPFADSVASFKLLPGPMINLLALGLPAFELTMGSFLLFGPFKRVATLGALVLTGGFALALASALLRGLPVDCGCFGSGSSAAHQGWVPLGRDLLLVGMAVLLYRRELDNAPGAPVRRVIPGSKPEKFVWEPLIKAPVG